VPKHLSWRYRRLRSIAQRLRTSLALRGWRGTLSRVAQEFAPRPVLDDTLHLIPLDGPLEPFAVAYDDAPVVSVVIPAYGNLPHTLACLRSVAACPPERPIEVIVVDDASPVDMVVELSKVRGLRVLRNASNLGFVGACNAGAAAARGAFLLFLNNDTQVTPGWLDHLVDFLEAHPVAGIAGSRLVYPDGRLQESGAWIFSDGSAWNIGRFERRSAPEHRYARQVDYVSGASLMIRRDLFDGLGGFDTRFAPGYYEDADLAFAVRHAGLQVWSVPSSTIIHAEGISSLGMENEGMKRFQAINQGKFVQKWRDALASQPQPNTPAASMMQRHTRGTMLVVDSSTPDATRDSGSVRLLAMMDILVRDDWHVVFIPDDGRADEAAYVALGALGVELQTRASTGGVPGWLSRHGARLHTVLLSRYTVASQYLGLVREQCPSARIVFDTVDLHFLREQRAAQHAGSASLARTAEASRRQELALIGKADCTLVVSPVERELLQQLAPQANVRVLSNIHTVHGTSRGHSGRRDLLFIGGYGHPPNADAMSWMADALLPALHAAAPGTRILVAGDVPEGIRDNFSAAGLTMLGRVGDLGPLMDACLASIAPLRFGAGVKGKINMSMSYGLPVIATAVAIEGMNLTDGVDVLLAEEPTAMATAYVRLLGDQDMWQGLSSASIAHVARYFSPGAAAAVMREVMG
jgi:GT2 family glycosyltransferase